MKKLAVTLMIVTTWTWLIGSFSFNYLYTIEETPVEYIGIIKDTNVEEPNNQIEGISIRYGIERNTVTVIGEMSRLFNKVDKYKYVELNFNIGDVVHQNELYCNNILSYLAARIFAHYSYQINFAFTLYPPNAVLGLIYKLVPVSCLYMILNYLITYLYNIFILSIASCFCFILSIF